MVHAKGDSGGKKHSLLHSLNQAQRSSKRLNISKQKKRNKQKTFSLSQVSYTFHAQNAHKAFHKGLDVHNFPLKELPFVQR